jgi:hypothetical protein
MKANLIYHIFEALNPALAGILDNMKAKNPTVWVFVIAILASAFFGIEYLVAEEIISEATGSVLKFIDLFMIALTGSRTRDILNKHNNDDN